MSSTSPYSKDPFHKFVDWVFSKIQKYKMELFFVTVAILLFAGCQNSIMNTLQKHIVGTLFKEIASHDILLRGGAVVFLLLCLVVFSRHIYHRYHYSSKQYFWVGFITSIYIVFRFFPPHCTQPTHWYWDFIPFSEHYSYIKYFDLWFLVPLGMGIVWGVKVVSGTLLIYVIKKIVRDVFRDVVRCIVDCVLLLLKSFYSIIRSFYSVAKYIISFSLLIFISRKWGAFSLSLFGILFYLFILPMFELKDRIIARCNKVKQRILHWYKEIQKSYNEEKKKNQKADLFDDKEEERYYKLFPSRRIQVDFVLTQLNGLGSERSFAFGITCPWGGGKTSFLNGVKDRIQKNGWSKNDFIQREHLAEDIAGKCEDLYKRNDKIKITEEDVIFVDYKPWFASGSKHVVAHFLDALQKSLSPYDGELAGSIAKYRKLLLSLNPGVFKSFVDGIVDFFSVHKDIEDRFKNVEKCIQRLNKKILVFMDDLDRLEANELVASLKIIRNTGSFKNVVFFVTYDKEYVLSQLASHFNFDKTDKKQGDRFLEKFFQLEIPLTQLYPSELIKYVKDLINDNLSAVLDDHDLLKEDSVGSFFRFQNVVYNELEEELNNLPNMEETKKDRKKIMDILELIPTIDLMIEIQSPRYWNRIINQVSLSSELLKSGDVDLAQLFLMIVFKHKYPLESYQVFRELLNSNGDSFMSRGSNISYDGQHHKLVKYMNKRIYEIGNYDLKYIQYVGAFFVNKTHSSIGFYRNYLHYYNLSFPLTYINPDCFNRLLNNPNEVRIIKNSNDENKYLGFNKMLYENDLSQVNLYVLLIFDIIINEEELFIEGFFTGNLSVLNHRVENVFCEPLLIEKLDEDKLFSVLKEINYVEESAILGYLRIWIPYQRNLNISTKKLENVAIRYFRYRIKDLTISLLQFGVIFSSEDSYNNFTDKLKSELNEFVSDNYENLLTFIRSVILFKEKIGTIHNGFFELDVFAAAKDENFINFIDDYELKEQNIEKKDIIHTYDQLINTCQPTALGKLI